MPALPLQPAPLTLACFAYMDNIAGRDDLARSCARADLVVALGGVDLEELSLLLPPRKAALCVLGPRDAQEIPARFRLLHGNGFTFRGWRIAGLSGAPMRTLGGLGHYVSESEASTLLEHLPACDVLLTHSPPSGVPEIEQSGIAVEQGLVSITDYIEAKEPIYHLYAHPSQELPQPYAKTLTIGVCGHIQPLPSLQFV